MGPLALLSCCFFQTQTLSAHLATNESKKSCRNCESIVEVEESTSAFCSGVLQQALCHASHQKLVERRAKALTNALSQHLGEEAVLLRIYAPTQDGTCLVLLASSADNDVDDRPGSYVSLPPLLTVASAPTSMLEMLHAALISKRPVTFTSEETTATSVAAPQLLEDTVASILWIQQRQKLVVPAATAAKAATDSGSCVASTLKVGPTASGGDGGRASGDLRNPAILQHLTLATAIVLAAGVPDLPYYLSNLAAGLRRLADCLTLKPLVVELSGILEAHIQRHFLLESTVRVAVVPLAESQVAFLLEEEGPLRGNGGGGGGGGGNGLAVGTAGQVQVLLTATSPLVNGNGSDKAGGGGGGDNVYGSTGGGGGDVVAVSGNNLAHSGPQVVAATKLDAPGSRASTGTGTGTRRRGSCLGNNATLLLGPAAGTEVATRNRIRGTVQGVRRTSSEMDLSKASRAPSHSLLPPAGQAGALLADTPPICMRGRAVRCCVGSYGGRQQLSLQSSLLAGSTSGTEAGGASGTWNALVSLAALRAKPFRLSETMLHQMMVQGSSSGRDRGDRGGSSGVLIGDVVADCLQYVQSLRLPSRDVYLLLNTAAGGGGGGGREPVGFYDSNGMCASPASSVRGCVPAAAGLAMAPAGGSFVGIGGGGGGSAAATVKSLALVGIGTEDGKVLALYVSFPFTLAPHMLTAIRDSCADLLDAVLAQQVRHKLQGPCAPELETLAVGVPGSYVIVPNCKAPTVPPSGLRCPQPSRHGMIESNNSGGGDAANTAAGSRGYGTAVADITASGGGSGGGGSSHLPESLPPPPPGGPVNLLNPTLSAPLEGLTTGGATLAAMNPAAVREAKLLGGSGADTGTENRFAMGPTPFKAVQRSCNRRSPMRAMSARNRAACLWDNYAASQIAVSVGGDGGGGGDADVVRGGGRVLPTAHGMCGGGGTGPASLVASSCLAGSGGSNVVATRRDTLPTELLQGPLEVLSNDAALLTLLEAECEGSARMQLGVLVESMMSTLRDSSVSPGVEDVYELISSDCRPTGCTRPLSDDLEELSLTAMVGTGASGVVLMGKLATIPVAVKLMELPAGAFSEGGQKSRKSSSDCGDEGGNPPPLSRRQRSRLEARRTLLRSATELAVLRTVNHINIVQVYAVYNNVLLKSVTNGEGDVSYKLSYCRRGEVQNLHGPGECPPCVAVCMELADCGSLENVLVHRTFPRRLQDRKPGARHSEAMMHMDLKGVYLTLLDIALALRHLHSRRLVHRDVKPANILLKSNPGDPRGWCCKLADFGFALVLDRQRPAENGSGLLEYYTVQEQACGTVTHMAPEALRPGSQVDSSVDLFSLGIVMWEIAAGRGYRPYKHLDQADIPSAVLDGLRPVFPGGVIPAQYRKMAEACWSTEPHKRPSAADVVTFAKEQLEQLNGQTPSQKRPVTSTGAAAGRGFGAGAGAPTQL